jgi:hypothetical protein
MPPATLLHCTVVAAHILYVQLDASLRSRVLFRHSGVQAMDRTITGEIALPVLAAEYVAPSTLCSAACSVVMEAVQAGSYCRPVLPLRHDQYHSKQLGDSVTHHFHAVIPSKGAVACPCVLHAVAFVPIFVRAATLGPSGSSSLCFSNSLCVIASFASHYLCDAYCLQRHCNRLEHAAGMRYALNLWRWGLRQLQWTCFVPKVGLEPVGCGTSWQSGPVVIAGRACAAHCMCACLHPSKTCAVASGAV